MKPKLSLLTVITIAGLLLTILAPSANNLAGATGSAVNNEISPAIVPNLRYMSVPAAAFSPDNRNNDYENHGRYLKFKSDPNDSQGYFTAPLNLPQGSTIFGVTFYFRDMGSGEAVLYFWRKPHGLPHGTELTGLGSTNTWPPGFGSAFQITDGGPNWIVDNSQYSYYLGVVLPSGGEVWNAGAEIAYLPPATASGTNYLSVPAAAFNPRQNAYAYQNNGDNLYHISGTPDLNYNGLYLAPVNLPQGATIKKFTFYWQSEYSSYPGIATLQRSSLGYDTYEDMASAVSGIGNVTGSTSHSSIAGAVIDNSHYSYWVVLDLPAEYKGAKVSAIDIKIDYTNNATINPVPPRVSVPAGAFRPFEDGYNYFNHSRHLIYYSCVSCSVSDGWFVAPAYLPQGAVISKMTFFWYENSSLPGTLKLQRTKLGEGNYEDLAVVTTDSGGPPTTGTSSDTTIAGGAIDNSQYAYWLVLVVPAQWAGVDVQAQAVVLEMDLDTSGSYKIFLPAIQHQYN